MLDGGLQVIDYMDVCTQYPISNTPALILIRDDLQGPGMLDEDDLEQNTVNTFLEMSEYVYPYQSRVVYAE